MAAAGSATITEVTHKRISKVKWAWTCDASGNVSGGAGLTTKTFNGKVIGLATDPDGTDIPTDNYDIEIRDADGMDVLFGGGANRDTANNEYVSSGLGAVVESTLELVVSNAGNAKKGVAILYIEQ